MKNFCPKCMKWNIDYFNIITDPLLSDGYKYHCKICGFKWNDDLMQKAKKMMKFVIKKTKGKYVSEEEMQTMEKIRKEIAKEIGVPYNE